MAFSEDITLPRDTGTLISDPLAAISGTFRVQNIEMSTVLVKASATTTPPTDWGGAIRLQGNDPITGTMADLFPNQPTSGYLHAISYSISGKVSCAHG